MYICNLKYHVCFLGSNLGRNMIVFWEMVWKAVWTLILTMTWMAFVVWFQILTVAVLLVKTSSLLKHKMVWRVPFLVSVQVMEVKFAMTTKQKIVFACLQATHALNFLIAIHIVGLRQHMSSVEYRTIIWYRLMIPLFPLSMCGICLT